LYDASGQKLNTLYSTLGTPLVVPINDIANLGDPGNCNDYLNRTDYVGNIEYAFSNDCGDYQYDLDKIYNSEGYVNVLYYTLYNYFRRDHLGNNREVWRAPWSSGSTNYAASTIQRTQYYPSGLPWASNSGDNPSMQNKKYNGKEFVEMHGYDTYDYGARGYYPAIGRFTSVDPLAEKYYSISPYAYCAGNPVNRIDPDGRFVMSAAMQKAYPRLTENMQNIASEWSGKSTQFKNALIESSGLNEKQITNMLTFGKGPILQVENLDTETSQSNGRTFLDKSPDGKVYNIGNGKISLDDDVVNMLESAQSTIDKTSGNIIVESTVLHEATHIGNAQTTNTGNGKFIESGKNFETRAYGMDISRSNVRSFAAEVTPQTINAKIPLIQVTPVQVPIKVQLP
jgi:RHS repeat-associated protein